MSRIVTVLRSGGDFGPGHVWWLKKQCDLFMPDVDFVCLSDVEIAGVRTVPMMYKWPLWWGKLELFEHFDDALYLDLDTVVLGGLYKLLSIEAPDGELIALRRFSGHPGMASGVMRWNGDLSYLTREFLQNPPSLKKLIDFKQEDWGDQGFIWKHYRGPGISYVQDLLPYYVQSWKRHLDGGKLMPLPVTRIICFHGQPRPWDVRSHYVPEMDES